MSLGSLVVSLGLNAVDYTQGLTKAEQDAQKFARTTTAVFKGTFAGNLAADFGAAIGRAIGSLPGQFDALVKSAGNFQDMAEKVGDSASNWASLAVAAGTAGTAMEEVTAFSIRLTKNLTGVDDESKAAGAAITALGLDLRAIKDQKPADQLEAIAKALNSFGEGKGKTAALEALAKGGAQLLPFLKELGAEGARQVILTEEQIRVADEYADGQAKSTAQLRLYAQAAASTAAGPLLDLTNALKETVAQMIGVSAETGKLKADNGIKDFAESAADALAFLVDSFDGLKRAVQVTGIFLAATAAQVDVALHSSLGNISENMNDLRNQAKADMSAILDVPLFSERLKQARLKTAADAAAIANFVGPMPKKATLNFEGAEKKDKKAPVSEAQRYLETLQKQAEAADQMTAREKALNEIQKARLEGITPKLKEQILAQAQIVDQLKHEEQQRRSLESAIADVLQARLRDADAAIAEAKSLVEGNDALAMEIPMIGASVEARYALEKARISSAIALKEEALLAVTAEEANVGLDRALKDQIEQLQRRQDLLGDKQAAEKFAEQMQQMEDGLRSVRDTFEQTIGSGLEMALDGNFKGIGDMFKRMLIRMAADAAAANITKAIFGGSNGSGSGFDLSSILSLFKAGGITSGDSGFSQTGEMIHGRHASGLAYVPFDGYRAELHKGERVMTAQENRRSGGDVYITNTAGARVSAQRDTSGDWQVMVEAAAELAHQRVAADHASGTGPSSRGLKSRGVNLSGNLPRRK